MNLKKLITLSWCSLLVCSLFAQNPPVDFNNYHTVLSQGELPREFATTSTEKYIENSKTITREDNRKTRRAKREFYLQSSFAIDNVLRSGRVLYNDVIGAYVNKVFDKVLENDPETRSQVKVFVVKTEYSNAFATDQGIIFITTGLLARLQNEAQLAFVLCHELVHFKKKHSIDVYVTEKTSDRESLKKTGGFESEPEILSRAAYSKEKETEADEEGLELFLQSGYNPREAVNAFDVLHYSYLPFDTVKIKNTFFDAKNLVWPYEYFKDEVTPIFAEEDEDDAKSTHPNTFKRKQTIKYLLGDKKDAGGKSFIISENDFFYIQKICRYELCRQALLNQNYGEAIYYATALQKENPESLFLKKVIAKSLFAVSAYAAEKEKNKLDFDDYKKIQGDLQQIYYFFNKIKSKEASVLAAQYLWRLRQAHPDDDELTLMTEKTFYLLAKKHEEKPYYFADTALPDNLNPKLLSPKYNAGAKEAAADTASSPDKLKQKDPEFKTQTKKNRYGEEDEDEDKKAPKMDTRHAFSEFIQDSAFKKMFLAQVKKAENSKTDEAKNKKRIKGLNKAPGEKIVILSPFHYSIDERKKQAVKLDANEKEMSVFIGRLAESAKAAQIPIELLAEKELKTNDAEKLNRLSLLKDWLGEKLEHDEMDILPTDYEQIMALRKEIDARYMCLVGHIHLIEKKENLGLALFVSIVPYTWPYTIPYLLKKQQVSMTFMMVLDLETGKHVKTEFSTIKASNTEDINLSTLYDFMLKIKKYQLENK